MTNYTRENIYTIGEAYSESTVYYTAQEIFKQYGVLIDEKLTKEQCIAKLKKTKIVL